MADLDMPPLVDQPNGFDNYAFPSPGRNNSPHLPMLGTPWPPQQAGSFMDPNMAAYAVSSPGPWCAAPAGYFMQPTMQPTMIAAPAAGWPGMTPGVPVTNPLPNASPAQFTRDHDGWVNIDHEDADDRHYQHWPSESFGKGLDRSRSKRSSTPSATSFNKRPKSPFSSSNSSPLSHSTSFSHSSTRLRSRSLTKPVSEDEKRPPREWRPDFSMVRASPISAALSTIFSSPRRPSQWTKNGKPLPIFLFLSSLMIGITDVDIGFFPIVDAAFYNKVALHPYLRHTSDPPMFLDLRTNPETVQFRDLGRTINQWDLLRFVCEPPLPHMRLYSPFYPWYIEVETSNPSGITLHDLFLAIWHSVQHPIASADYYNTEMDHQVRDKVAHAWAGRCGDDEEQRGMGVRRVDFLMERVVLRGLTKGKDGMWEMKLEKHHPL